jgi:drug/metabolite transporter (DMT)-like permease
MNIFRNLLKPDFEKPLWQWAAIIVLAFTWGSSFILMKKGLESYTHLQVASIRMFSAAVVLFPIAFRNIKVLKTKYFMPLLISGLFGNGIPSFLFAKAQTGISSAFAGMLNSLTPFFTLVIGAFAFRANVVLLQVIGVLIGLVGATGLILSDGTGNINVNFGFGSYVIAACICYGISVNTIKTYLYELNSRIITSLALLLITPVILVILLGTEVHNSISTKEDYINLFYLILLGVVGTSLAVILFNMLIKKTSAVFASSVTYLIPIVSIFWGMVDGESVHFYDFLFTGVILCGVYLVNYKKAA